MSPTQLDIPSSKTVILANVLSIGSVDWLTEDFIAPRFSPLLKLLIRNASLVQATKHIGRQHAFCTGMVSEPKDSIHFKRFQEVVAAWEHHAEVLLQFYHHPHGMIDRSHAEREN